MTGNQLRMLRESRGLTRAELAEELGDCSASGLVKWEHGVSPVPEWVAKEMLRQVIVPMPFDALAELVTLAQESGITFESMMIEAIRDYIAKHAPPPALEVLKVADSEAKYGADKK